MKIRFEDELPLATVELVYLDLKITLIHELTPISPSILPFQLLWIT